MHALHTAIRFCARLRRAWWFYRRLHYTWRLAWIKSGWSGA